MLRYRNNLKSQNPLGISRKTFNSFSKILASKLLAFISILTFYLRRNLERVIVVVFPALTCTDNFNFSRFAAHLLGRVSSTRLWLLHWSHICINCWVFLCSKFIQLQSSYYSLPLNFLSGIFHCFSSIHIALPQFNSYSTSNNVLTGRVLIFLCFSFSKVGSTTP